MATQAYYYIDNVALHAIDAGPDLNLTCGPQPNPPTLGGPPLPATANATYQWSPRYGLSNPTSPNPQVLQVGGTINYTLTVTINGQSFTDVVTVNGSGVCPCNHPYTHQGGPANSYQAAQHNAGNQPYEIGVAGQVTTIDISQSPYNGQVIFDGTYHVLGPVKFENGEAVLRQGTTFYFDADQPPSALLQPSCHSAIGINEYASRLYAGKESTLRLEGATLTSTCEQLWGGVTLISGGKLHLMPVSAQQSKRNEISHAYVGVLVEGYCSDAAQPEYYVHDTDIFNCRFGLFDVVRTQVVPGEGVQGCLFSSNPATMLAPFRPNANGGYYTETGIMLDGPGTSGLQLQYNTFDNLVKGAQVSGNGTTLRNNTFTRCYFFGVGVGAYLNGLTYSRQVTVRNNTITVPNDYFNANQINDSDVVAGIVLNEYSPTPITVFRNTISGAGSSPTATGKQQAGVISYNVDQVTIQGNAVGNLDHGLELQNVGGYACMACPSSPIIGTVVADNTLTGNSYGVYLKGNPQYAYVIPQIACNTLNNSSLSGINYGIFLASQTYLPDLGSNGYRNANLFVNALGTSPVWNEGGGSTTYWGYNGENTSNSGAGPGSLLSLNLIAPPNQVCNNRDYTAGLNRNGVTAQMVVDWQQQILRRQGPARERWQLEQEVLRYYHNGGRQAALETFVRTLPLFNDSAFYRLSFYLLDHYQRTGQAAARQSLRTYVLLYGSADAEVVQTLAYAEAMQRLAQARRGLSAADSLLLTQVAQSGGSLADAACMTLRLFHPGLRCGGGTLPPSLRAGSVATPARPRISGLYPNPAADQVRVRCTGLAGLCQVVVRDLRTGKVVGQVGVQSAGGEAQLDTSRIPAGLYACQLVQDGRVVGVERLQIAR
ncbi:hypothetical protein EJV47_02190 [Hymenobacter gummosus]|uniref:Uncharacterized protein n=1 Tax=Hymenobacter gummosus TaxID=1776032 RepID=A0A431U8K4_9BACT|nr:hypothetical protein [Hymenobacter gummosus]RTQ53573.1 hypothetical protein EJV47_02190 [Hymenobacter gummosus]